MKLNQVYNWTVYILHCADGSVYTGISTDVQKRVRMHEAGTGAKYTRGRGPFRVIFTETHATKSEALSREMAIKKLSKQAKLALHTVE